MPFGVRIVACKEYNAENKEERLNENEQKEGTTRALTACCSSIPSHPHPSIIPCNQRTDIKDEKIPRDLSDLRVVDPLTRPFRPTIFTHHLPSNGDNDLNTKRVRTD